MSNLEPKGRLLRLPVLDGSEFYWRCSSKVAFPECNRLVPGGLIMMQHCIASASVALPVFYMSTRYEASCEPKKEAVKDSKGALP